MKPAASTLTLQDIADIAHVRRPVVSMWRSREYVNGEQVPFPPVVDVRADVEHFDRDEVVAWVDRTGRGNNAEFAADARAAAIPGDASFDEVVVLLCLAFIAGRPLGDLDADQLVDLADECDPDDLFLFSEVERLADNASALLHYVDDLRSVAFGPADALARVESSRLARTARATFDAAGVRAFAAVTEAIAIHMGNCAGSLTDASEGSSGLALDVARTWSEGSCDHLLVEGDSPAARRQRRAALLHGIGPAQHEIEAEVSLLAVTAMSPTDALCTIDELQLTLSGGVAIVVGPATLLCDALNDPDLESARDAIVRTGTLRFAARLPRGLWLPAPRQALGMWIFGSQTARRIEDRAVALADLSHEDTAALSVDDLATDAVASLGDLRGRAFRFSRVMPTSRLIAAREIVPRGAHPVRHIAPKPADRIVRIEALFDALAEPFDVRRVSLGPGEDGSTAAYTSLGALIDRLAVALVRGNRLDTTLATSGGAVRLFDPVSGDTGLRFDPVDLEANHPRAGRTEPGDVVFTHTPRPAARVDEQGGSVVASPARVLRVRGDAPVGAHALSHTIGQMPAHAREWRSWQIPVADPDESEALEAALVELFRLRAELSNRISMTTDLATEMIEAVAARAVTVTTETVPSESRD